jgi:hypothetical protein
MNPYFILSLVSLLSAVLIVALKVCYASKCDKIELCFGLIKINREVEFEQPQFREYVDTSNQDFYVKQTNNEQSRVAVSLGEKLGVV